MSELRRRHRSAGGVGGEAGPAIHYTARIRNNGVFAISYNLNVGDWQ